MVSDLRARTVQVVRSHLTTQSTRDLEEEWQQWIDQVTDLFGVHPFVAFVFKEYGNCLFDMGRFR